MASQQIEGTLDALVAKLNANLTAKVEGVNADVTGDDYFIEPPHGISIGARADMNDYPWVFVLPETTMVAGDTGGLILYTHTISVMSFIAAFQEEELARKLLRFQRAVRECLLELRQPSTAYGGPGGYSIRLIRDEYSDVFRENPDTNFVQGARSIFEVSQQQNL